MTKSKRRTAKRRREVTDRNASTLINAAIADPSFDGNFVRLAAKLGWTNGTFWWRNPAIGRAVITWQANDYFDAIEAQRRAAGVPL